jgi:Predicted nucleotide-binding protein containing TIR-like domain
MKGLWIWVGLISGVVPGLGVVLWRLGTPEEFRLPLGLIGAACGPVAFAIHYWIRSKTTRGPQLVLAKWILIWGCVAVVAFSVYWIVMRQCVVHQSGNSERFFPLFLTGQAAKDVAAANGPAGFYELVGPIGVDRMLRTQAIPLVLSESILICLFSLGSIALPVSLGLIQSFAGGDTHAIVTSQKSTMEYEAPQVIECISEEGQFQRTRNDMTIIRRIYISMPADEWLAPNQNDLKWGIVEEIERLGYIAEIFNDPSGRSGIAAGQAWSAIAADKVARRCVGAAIIGLPRWEFAASEGKWKLPTEYCHYEGAIAYTLGLPMLVVVQDDVQRRVVFDPSFRGQVGVFPASADRTWLFTRNFRVPFNHWKEELSKRRDFFLGYCSSSTGVANNLKRFLEADIGATVLDWRTDFAPGQTILQQMQQAVARCTAGVFLFTKDDKLTDDAHSDKAVPRDNVVFEAGCFISAKGEDHVLIDREAGAKIPADLGGNIYASLEERSNIGPIEDEVRKFIKGWKNV